MLNYTPKPVEYAQELFSAASGTRGNEEKIHPHLEAAKCERVEKRAISINEEST